MSDDQNAQNGDAPTTGEGNKDDAPDTAAQEAQVAREAEARKMGWRPKDEYKGPPERFIDFEEFLENGEKVLPIVRAENKALRREIDRLADQHKEFAKIVDTAHERQVAELQAALTLAKEARKQAVTDSDGEAHEAADEQVKSLEAQLKVPAPKTGTPDPTKDPVYTAWLADHPRIEQDEDFFLMCEGLARQKMFDAYRGKGAEFYNAVYAEAERRLDKGRDLSRPGPARGNRGSDNVRSTPTTGQRSYENLQPEYKKACDDMGRNYGKAGTPAEAKKWRETYVSGCTDEAFKG